jgi:hypothetical protein
MLGFIGECACKCPGALSGLGADMTANPAAAAQLDAAVAAFSMNPTPQNAAALAAAQQAVAASATPTTTTAQDVGSAIRNAFSIPGQVLGPVASDISKDPLLGPLAALGIQSGLTKLGVKTPQGSGGAPAPAPWTTGEKLALGGGLVVGAAALGYALSRPTSRRRR